MKKSFSSILKKHRKDNRLTQEKLAEKINIKYGVNFNKGMISKWENGHPATLENIKLLSLYFDVTLNELLNFNLDVENKKVPIFKSFQTGLDIYSEENRSEEHTSELQSRGHLVCRLLL